MDNWLPTPYRIAAKRRETLDSFTIELEPVEGKAPSFLPGQFNMLYAFGAGEVPISFSSCQRVEHTLRVVGSVTNVLSRYKVGQQIGVRGPFGRPWPLAKVKGKNLLLVAGGIGLAPIRPVMQQILLRREDYQTVTLLYGARNPSERLFVKELLEWKERLEGHVYVSVDVGDAAWTGNVGVVSSLFSKIPFSLKGAAAFLCGPEMMMRITARQLLQRGGSSEEIYLSMERNMKCAIGHCGRCQLAPHFICKEGPIFSYAEMEAYLGVKAL